MGFLNAKSGSQRVPKALRPKADVWIGFTPMTLAYRVWLQEARLGVPFKHMAGEDAFINIKYVVPTYESAVLCGDPWLIQTADAKTDMARHGCPVGANWWDFWKAVPDADIPSSCCDGVTSRGLTQLKTRPVQYQARVPRSFGGCEMKWLKPVASRYEGNHDPAPVAEPHFWHQIWWDLPSLGRPFWCSACFVDNSGCSFHFIKTIYI